MFEQLVVPEAGSRSFRQKMMSCGIFIFETSVIVLGSSCGVSVFFGGQKFDLCINPESSIACRTFWKRLCLKPRIGP